MAVLNVTYEGISADLPQAVPDDLSDGEIRTIVTEVIRSGGMPGLFLPELPDDALNHFVVDRYRQADGSPTIYVRPKVPFGQ
jgi:hypothetical protein